jgi:PAS domain S-box-containing protein
VVKSSDPRLQFAEFGPPRPFACPAARLPLNWGRVPLHSREIDHGRVPPLAGLFAGYAALAAMIALDIALGRNVALVGTYAIAPFIVAISGSARATVAAAVVATAAAGASGLWNDNLGDGGWLARLLVIAAAGGFAIYAAQRIGAASRAVLRYHLLDQVSRTADGSLPLAETLERVTEAVVPAFADLCMIDAIHEGNVRRVAVRSHGKHTERIESHIGKRTPSTPEWLRDPGSDSLEPRFERKMPDPLLQRMANDEEDLSFLRWLRPRSNIVAPMVCRGRSLGTFTAVRLSGSPEFRHGDVEFATAVASRIAIALDNAGLFSDLESVERRMDSVMDSVSEAVIVHDGDGNLVYANAAATELVGFEKLQDMTSAKPGQRDPRFRIRDEAGLPLDPGRLPRRRVLAGEEPEPMVFRLHDADAERESWRLEKSTPIRGASGEVLYAVTTVEDVTAVKQDEFSQRLLADSAEALASATDYRAALAALTRAVVPQLADWCSVNVPAADGTIEQVGIADDDATMLALDRRLREGMPMRSGRKLSMNDVLRASHPVTAELPDDTPGWVLLKPIRAGGGAIGVLTLINRPGRRAFSAAEIRLARAVADRAGVAILNAKLAGERAEIAETLQQELLPPLLPEIEGWSMAAMYRPAGEQNRAGGDFYDVFEGANGWVVVLGDVEGHGAAAAALTATVRHTIRTAAMVDGDLLGAFRLLNDELRRRSRARLCSAVCIGFGNDEQASVVTAGHPLPLLVSEGEVREVGLPGSLLGAFEEPQWSPVRFTVGPGEELVIYTDGVVEARSNGKRFGRERLRELLSRFGSPGDAVREVGEAIDSFAEKIEDDAAMVVLRREQPQRRITAPKRAAAPVAETLE